MTMMFLIHDAMRRDLAWFGAALRHDGALPAALRAQLARAWAEFADNLEHHHSAEDAELWPALLAECPSAAGVLAELEAEHAVIGPLLARASLAMSTTGTPEGLRAAAAAVSELAGPLTAHLAHEEAGAVPLAARHLGDYLPGFEARRRREAGLGGLTRFMPWVLDGADPARAAWLRTHLPPPVRAAVALFLRRRRRRTAALRATGRW